MNFGRHFERSETRQERNKDDDKSNSKSGWVDHIDLADKWVDHIDLDDKKPSKESYANILQKYLIPAMESVNESVFTSIFCEDDYMRYKTDTAKVNGKSYDLSKYRYLKNVMTAVIEDRWSESDFIKFIEENINYKDKDKEIYYWAEDDVTDPLSEQDKRFQKVWENLKLICVSQDGSGNTLFYSKNKHGFFFINHENTREENFRNFIKWNDAVEGFGKFNLGLVEVKRYCKKLINFYKVSDKCSLISSENDKVAFSIKTRKEYNIERNIEQIVNKVRSAFTQFNIKKEIDDDKIYYDFYIVK